MHWTISLADYFFRTRLLGQALPLLASFKLTYSCNLACRACPFHQRSDEPSSYMSWATAVSRLQNLSQRGCRLIVFEGGEPLLWKDSGHGVDELLLIAKKLFLRTALTTNGTFELNRPADILWVSIDGLPETHNRLRSGSFSRIRENLLAARHQKILVHHTINRENRRELKELLDLLARIPSVKGMTLQFFYPYGRGEDDLSLNPIERREAVEAALELKRQGYPIFNSSACLRDMVDNNWTCRDRLLINVDPDGTVTQGCYAKSRAEIRCDQCGFTPVAEAAAALKLRPGALMAGWRTFIKK